MKKKHRKLQTKENIIVFPGTSEKLISDGIIYAENGKYTKAVASFDEAKMYTELDETALTVYAYSLFEMRRYNDAKRVCEQLLEEGSSLYEQIMELYLTILIELKEYKEVEALLQTLMEEEVFSEEKRQNFEQLRDLSIRLSDGNISEVYDNEEVAYLTQLDKNKYIVENFFSKSGAEQHQLMYEASQGNFTEILPELIEIAQFTKGFAIIKTLAVLLLGAAGIEEEVRIEKFGFSKKVMPTLLPHPTEVGQVELIFSHIQNKLEQDPTKFELVHQMISRHAFALFPFGWEGYKEEEIAGTYVNYVNHLFEQEEIIENELIHLLFSLEEMYDLIENQ